MAPLFEQRCENPLKKITLVHGSLNFLGLGRRGYPNVGLMAIIDRNGVLSYDRICDSCRDLEVYITLNTSKRQIVVGGLKKV